ncbi:11782_t:CDS:1, partial [Ambispora leptoticha]
HLPFLASSSHYLVVSSPVGIIALPGSIFASWCRRITLPACYYLAPVVI